MTDEEIAGQKQRAVNRAAAILSEHFDAGVVLASHCMSDDRTGRVFKRFGNVYAQIGMADRFLDRMRDAMDDADNFDDGDD